MRLVTEENITDLAAERWGSAHDPRLAEIMSTLVRHLHDFAREVRLTEEEWIAAIRWLTATGQVSDEKREEFILASDVLGLSMLVVQMNHDLDPGATPATVLGPFHIDGSPELESGADMAEGIDGIPLYVHGTVRDLAGKTVGGALLDVWQADDDGMYESQLAVEEARLRAKYTGGADGSYCVRTVAPLGYSIPVDGPVGELIAQTPISHYRPAHVHFIVTAQGYERLVTHLFREGAEYLDSDVVFGVKEELVVRFEERPAGDHPGRRGVRGAVAGGPVRLRAAAARLTGGSSVSASVETEASPVEGAGMGSTGVLAGHRVARVGFGAMQLEGRFAPVAREDAIGVLRAAVAGGVDHVDTAEFYGGGSVNALIRDALHPCPEGLVLVSKVGAAHDPARGLVAAQRPHELRAAVEANLRSLGVDRIDVVNLRRVDRAPGIVATGEQVVPLDDQLAELVALRDAGAIGAIGLSTVDAGQVRAAATAGIVCVQNMYNVLDREDEPVFDAAREIGAAWVPYFPLGSGFPGRPAVRSHRQVQAVAARLGVTPTQIGLAWLLALDPSVLLIPGTANPAHLAENLAAADVELDAEALDVLNRLATEPAPASPR